MTVLCSAKSIDEDAAQKLEDYLSSMLIGQNGWNPAELAFPE